MVWRALPADRRGCSSPLFGLHSKPQSVGKVSCGYDNEWAAPMTRDSASEISYVWWVYPDGDVYQHATSECPPHEGGPVNTLGDGTVDAPPAKDIRLHPFRPFCRACLFEFLVLPPATPLWIY